MKQLDMSKILIWSVLIILFVASYSKEEQPKVNEAVAYFIEGASNFRKGQLDQAISNLPLALSKDQKVLRRQTSL